MEHGPVDVIVVATGEPHFDGSVLSELERLSDAGTIRVLDAMVLLKQDDGTVATLDIENMPAKEKAKLGFVETGTRGLFDSEDAETLIEGMAAGSAVAAIAIEHLWAVGLVNSMQEAGVDIAMNWRIPAPVVDEAFASLANQAE